MLHVAAFLVLLPTGPPTPPELLQFGLTGKQVVTAWQFNLDYQKHLRERLEGCLDQWQREEIYAALAETQRLYQAWDALDDCWRGSEEARPRNLKKLWGRIGGEAYGWGVMPPCVPLRFFEER